MESTLCRVCRNPVGSAGGGISITDTSERCGRPSWDMLYQCTRIEITLDDILPKRLCMNCAERLEISFEFLDMCYASLSYFNSSIETQDQKPTETLKFLSSPDCHQDTIQISEVRSKIEEPNVHSQYNSSYSSCSTFELEDQKPDIDCLQNTNGDPLIEPLSVCTVQEETSSKYKNNQSDYEQYQAIKERNRLRTAWRRANRSEEDNNREKELNRLRAASRRANFTEDEKKRFNEYHRLKMASRRARQTNEQKEARRERNGQKSQKPTLVQTDTSKPLSTPDCHQEASKMFQTPENQKNVIINQQDSSYSSSSIFELEDQKPNVDYLQNSNSDPLIEPMSVATLQEETSNEHKNYQSDYEQCEAIKEKNRLRIASKRANRSEEETIRERELNRLRAASKRANFTEEEKKRFNEYQRMRMASRRARQTPEQKEAERERNRQKIAQRRALLRHHSLNLTDRMEGDNVEESFS